MPITTLAANSVLGTMLGTDRYVALLWGIPSDTDTGSTLSEIDQTGYTRKTLYAAQWSDPAFGICTYGTSVVWSITATWNQTILGYALCSAATAGDLLGYAYFESPIRLSVGSGAATKLTIPANSLSVEVI